MRIAGFFWEGKTAENFFMRITLTEINPIIVQTISAPYVWNATVNSQAIHYRRKSSETGEGDTG